MSETLLIKPAALSKLRVNWEKVARESVLVGIHISRWRARDTLMNIDLGLPADEQSKLVKLGERRLLPAIPPSSKFYDGRNADRTYPDLVNAIEKRVRRSTERYSLATPFGRLVPVENYEECMKAIETERKVLDEVMQELYENWDDRINDVMEEYAKMAQQSFERLTKLSVDKLSQSGVETLEAYKSQFLGKTLSAIPDAQNFLDMYRCSIDLSYLPLPSMLAEEFAKGRAILDQAELLSAEAQERKLASIDRAAIIAKMHKDVQEQEMRRVRKTVDDVVQAVVAQARERVVEVVSSAIESVKTNGGKVVTPVLSSINSLLEQASGIFQALGDDDELERMLAPLRSAMAKPDKNGIENILVDIQTTARASILAIQVDGRGVRSDELFELTGITSNSLRAARSNLGMETEIEIGEYSRQER